MVLDLSGLDKTIAAPTEFESDDDQSPTNHPPTPPAGRGPTFFQYDTEYRDG